MTKKNTLTRKRGKKVSPKYKTYLKDTKTKKLYKNVIEEYTGIAQIYDDKWKKYLAATEDMLLKQLKLKGKETIIDAGCGTGSLLCKICEKHKGRLIGFDITPAMLDLAELNVTEKKFNKNLSLELAHCENFNAKSNSVDIVICSSVLHALPHPEKALHEFNRVLKKNGRLLLLDICTDYLITRMVDMFLRLFHKSHHRAYSAEEVSSLLKKNKFTIISLKTWKATPMYGVMLFEAKKK